MDQYPLHVRLAIPLAVATIICIALGAAALQGAKIEIPVAFVFVFVIASIINLVGRLLLKRRGQKPWVSALWVVPMIGGMFAALLLGAATLLAWLSGIPGNELLVHAEVLLLVGYAVINVAGMALFRLAALLRPAPAPNR